MTTTFKELATTPSRAGRYTAAAAIGSALTAAWVQRRAMRAQRKQPVSGNMIEVDGTNLHYVEQGTGSPVVLIHGNTVTLRDFVASGLLDRLAQNHRVIAFDRPGFGHTERTRDRLWTPSAQGQLIHAALDKLNVDRAAVIGHSMGTVVSVAMALDRPERISSLVLLGGYYYPTMRFDSLLASPVALPVLGDAMRYTVTALSARATIKHAVKGMFAPMDVPSDFFPTLSREMMVRPVQLRANSEDGVFMIPAAWKHSERYAELRMPVSIMAGALDGIVDPADHSTRLHRELPHSQLTIVPDCGHMVHYAAQEEIAAAIAAQALSN